MEVNDLNPYASPNASVDGSEPTKSMGRKPDNLFFFINFPLALLLICSAAMAIAAPQSPGEFIGGIFFILPVSVYAVLEWIAWYRNRAWAYKTLSYLHFVAAALVAFGIVANLFEQQDDSAPPLGPTFWFWFWFWVIGLSLLGYMLTCGLHRFRRGANTQASDN